MTIHLTKDLEQFVQDAVRSGRYAREDDVVRDALTRLRQATPEGMPGSETKRTEPTKPPITPDELNRRLIAAGLVTQLPEPSQDLDDDDEEDDLPIVIEGEPLSETIIRERR